MIPLKWLVMLMTVASRLTPSVCAVPPSTCSWLVPADSGCVQSVECQDSGAGIYIWEDCSVGGELFKINDTDVSIDPDCRFASAGSSVTLMKKLDAENPEPDNMCNVIGSSETVMYFIVVNINEFPPQPTNGSDPITEVFVDENEEPGVAVEIYYSDQDHKETETLSCKQISEGYEDLFSLDPVDDAKGGVKTFRFSLKQELDFEKQAVYKVVYSIISKDERNNEKSATQTFFVYVVDKPDNPPFWNKIVPVYYLEECKAENVLFSVTAQDRDVEINYDIKYSMVEEPDDSYFDINEDTGVVSRIEEIDREELLEDGISAFTLVINATEYKDKTTEGEPPNSVQQVTTVLILDCNDQKPTFDQDPYEIKMDELTYESNHMTVPLEIVVTDMDEGINGSFTLTTSDAQHLSITPEGKQSQSVTLVAQWESIENNYFNYEVHQDKPLVFTLTATEKANPANIGTATLNIILRDVNDNRPNFTTTTYKINVLENKQVGSHLLTVEADDSDVSDDFGKPSISYSLLSSCHELDIDDGTGNVTLGSALDYEDGAPGNEISCTVSATDEYGDGLTGESEIIVTVLDVVDEPPWMEEKDIFMSVEENSAKGTEIGSFIVKDADMAADIDFSIVSSDCLKGAATPADVGGWFSVAAGNADHPAYPAVVRVAGGVDREACSEVVLHVMAVDLVTEEGVDNVNGTVTITVIDMKDTAPVFEGDYTGIYFDESYGNTPPEESRFVFTVTVSDPDEGDTINLSITTGGDKVKLSESVVTVEAGGKADVEVWTKEKELIDRETQATIELQIKLTNLEDHPSSTKNFTIHINDLNDNKPVIDGDLCSREPLPVVEVDDDDTGKANGTVIFQLKATDADIDSPYNEITFNLLNDQVPDSKNKRTPFTVDRKSGEVKILLTEKKILDRETDSTWELVFSALDDCRPPLDPTCTVLSSDPCTVEITVQDINDNPPRHLEWTPKGDIQVEDFIQEDEELEYMLRAYDDDNGQNASITYTVLGTFGPSGDEDMDLFYASDEPTTDAFYCRLHANKNFEGMNFTGTYDVIIEAKDGGNLTTNFSIVVEVVDGNDQAPHLVFEGCPLETNKTIIRMTEKDYTPGENQPNPMEVACKEPGGSPFRISFSDADKNLENKRSRVRIDTANSSVENAANAAIETELLSYWSLSPSTCENGCNLYLSHLIDRANGSAYNLALHVKNDAEPLQESWATVRIIVLNVMEYDPYFCLSNSCSQDVYMYENNNKASVLFKEANDLDNSNVLPGEDDYDDINYFIVGGDSNYFRTTNARDRKIILQNMPDGLDREDRGKYSLQILATNEDFPAGNLPANFTNNAILHLNILVGDENDEEPLFRGIIFTSFMETNDDNYQLTVIEAEDKDLNETLTYTIMDDLQWFDNDITPERSFTLEVKDPRSVYLKLDFDPKGMTRGYCNFTIHVEDAAGYTDMTQVKVYIMNEDYQVPIYFTNTLEDVKNKEFEIVDAFTESYEYACVIDSITPTMSSTGDFLSNVTTAYLHFIDEEKNEPVRAKIILDLSDNADVMSNLKTRLAAHDIFINSVGTYSPPAEEKSPEEEILMFKILLGVVSLVMGVLLVLVITVYCIRTKSLTRKVKVLSTTTFGSKEAGLNEMGHEMVPVPGSNFAAVHGNHNPVFSENGAFDFKNHDTGSINSGDSVLVGVEDNPDFKSSSTKTGPPSYSSMGHENPSFGRSIDEVSASPPGVAGGVKGNPLLNLGSLQDAPDSSPSRSQRTTWDDTEASDSDAGSFKQNMNSNFSLY